MVEPADGWKPLCKALGQKRVVNQSRTKTKGTIDGRGKYGSNRRPTFSIIMPIYNVERYLAEAIESVIGQTIGFEDNVELILVNDGSPDGSGQVRASGVSAFR
ncbi:glycosyltransferase family 2 protein [Corynebacterium phoceense]|uniref:glycosyltransferase family 2 protein n=1 Tax=Corynebacterium phoceense TaxID=1686286 RepID=UPI0027953BFB|nr:glycosyltransferase [Corynebacterium phoceense]